MTYLNIWIGMTPRYFEMPFAIPNSWHPSISCATTWRLLAASRSRSQQKRDASQTESLCGSSASTRSGHSELDHVRPRGGYQSHGAKRSAMLVNRQYIGRGRRIEFVILDLFIVWHAPLLSLDEHSVAEPMVGNPGLAMLMDACPGD